MVLNYPTLGKHEWKNMPSTSKVSEDKLKYNIIIADRHIFAEIYIYFLINLFFFNEGNSLYV